MSLCVFEVFRDEFYEAVCELFVAGSYVLFS